MDIPFDDVPLGLELKPLKRKKRKEIRDIVHTKKGKEYRKLHEIKVLRIPYDPQVEIPMPVTTFHSITKAYPKFNPLLLKNLADLSFILPTPIQAQSIPILLQHANLIACAPTGSGKTAAYLLPLLQHFCEHFSCSPTVLDTNGLTDSAGPTDHPYPFESIPCTLHKITLFGLILAPTQELVRQIWSEAIRLSKGITDEHFLACLGRRHYARRGKVEGSKSNRSDGVAKCIRKVRELRLPRSTRILIATPKRVGFLLSLEEKLCPFEMKCLSWLVVDECDKMLEVDLGSGKSGFPHSFRDQLDPIFSSIRKAQQPSLDRSSAAVALFSATIPDQVADWARTEIPSLFQSNTATNDQLPDSRGGIVQLRVGKRNSAVSTVSQELRYCGTEEGKLLEIRCLLTRGLTYPCLIFMESRERAKEIVKEILLSDSDILANVISGDKTEAQRSAIIRAFREGQLNVLVCTDLLGRGIDFKGVSMVINYDLPSSKEEYIHRVGRTGRAGQRGRAVTFWTDADLPYLGAVLKVMRRSGSQVDAELERLVAEWELRKSEMILGKNIGSRKRPNIIISGRRGERRLLRGILKKRKGDQTGKEHDHRLNSEESTKDLKWLRRWNPRRKRISELSGSKQKRTE